MTEKKKIVIIAAIGTAAIILLAGFVWLTNGQPGLTEAQRIAINARDLGMTWEDVEFAQHGHLGANESSSAQFKLWNVTSVYEERYQLYFTLAVFNTTADCADAYHAIVMQYLNFTTPKTIQIGDGGIMAYDNVVIFMQGKVLYESAVSSMTLQYDHAWLSREAVRIAEIQSAKIARLLT